MIFTIRGAKHRYVTRWRKIGGRRVQVQICACGAWRVVRRYTEHVGE